MACRDHHRTRTALLPNEHAIRQGDQAIQEERRLAYVAITRAQRELHLTHANLRALFGSRAASEPSRFLQEIAYTATDNMPDGCGGHGGDPAAAEAGVGPRPLAPSPAPPPSSAQPGTPTQPTPTGGHQAAGCDDKPSMPQPGDRIRHLHFGPGVVTAVDGPHLTVTFDTDPSRDYRIHATLARLTPRERTGRCQ